MAGERYDVADTGVVRERRARPLVSTYDPESSQFCNLDRCSAVLVSCDEPQGPRSRRCFFSGPWPKQQKF